MAVVYARELTRWGIETSIVVPGAFTGGTNHFAHSGRPADKKRVAEYETGPYKGFAEDVMKGFASDPAQDGAEVVNMVCDRVRAELLRRIGLADVLTPTKLV